MTGNLPRYTCAKNYQNRAWCDKVIAKIKWCTFFDSRGTLRIPSIRAVGFREGVSQVIFSRVCNCVSAEPHEINRAELNRTNQALKSVGKCVA